MPSTTEELRPATAGVFFGDNPGALFIGLELQFSSVMLLHYNRICAIEFAPNADHRHTKRSHR
ncbi:hypothetical protein [Mesorhizobium xinjiangense]|uniref:hypothetical protein n=1 Tax=Mesorhizobium xinjiangense TaxID=2678685 RepID=UPI0018DCCE6F|nr:hypothetical protein [Mesorhizobium xinjiangense]